MTLATACRAICLVAATAFLSVASALASAAASREIVFVDRAIRDHERLIGLLPAGAEIKVLDNTTDGLAQIADYLGAHDPVAAIHIFSEGREGAVKLGNRWVDGEVIGRRSDDLRRISRALQPGGDILFYGCNVAASRAGQDFISQLARHTGAKVAASSNRTGGLGQGGDWKLEFETGVVSARPLLDSVSAASYPHQLATLQAGDLAVTGWSALTDTVTIVALVTIPSGTVIKITDKGWDQSTNAFTTTVTADGVVTWTLSGSVSAGSVLQLVLGGSDNTPTTSLTNLTTSADLTADISLTGFTTTDPWGIAGDQIFIYQDADANPYFIFGFNNSAGTVDGSGWNTSVAVTLRDSMLPNGTGSQNSLTAGTDAVGMPGGASQQDNVQFTGSTTGTDRATWLGRVANLSNWTGDNTGTTTSSTGSSVSVSAPNAAPAFNDGATQTLTVAEDAAATSITSLLDVVDSDSSQTLTWSVTSSPTKGSLGGFNTTASTAGNATPITPTGLTYTPTANQNGADSFTIQVSDGSSTDSITVNVTINALNDDPTGPGLPTDVTVVEDTLSNFSISSIALADVDSAAGSLTVTLTASGGTFTASSGGSVTVGGSTTGTLTLAGTIANLNTFLDTAANIKYTGASNVNGNNAATVAVKINDGGNTGTGGGGDIALGTVNVDITAVNDAPTVATNLGLTVAEGGSGTITTARLNEGDPDDSGAGLTYTVTTLPANGAVRLSGTPLALNGTFTQADIDGSLATYLHNGGETTSDSFVFSLADGGEDGAAALTGQTFALTITSVNDAPTVATNLGLTVAEGGSGTITTARLNEGDPDDSGAGLTYTVTTLPVNGAVRLSGTPLALNGTFTQADIDGSLVTYLHNGGETTSDSFVFSLADGGENGAAAVTGQTFSLTITAVNDAPTVATNLGLTVAEGGSGTITTARLNEGDPDDSGAGLTYTVTTLPANGAVRLSGTPLALNGTFTQADIDGSLVTYLHNGGETTSDSFVFSLADGGENSAAALTGQTFALTITAVNDAPTVATNLGLTVAQGGSGTITTARLNEGDPDDSGAGLTYTVTTLPVNGAVRLSGTPLALNGTFTQADIDGSLVTYLHDGSETTSDSFVFSLADGGENGAAPVTGQTFSLTVTAVNDAPVLSGGPHTLSTTDENTTTAGVTVATILGSFTDTDADTGAPARGVAVTAKTSNGTWQYSTDGTTWTAFGSVSGAAALLLSNSTQVRYVPDNQNGETATLTIRSWDTTSGSASVNGTPATADTTTNGTTTAFSTGTGSVTLTVTSVNDAPTLSGGPYALTTTNENTTSSGTLVSTILAGLTYADVDTSALSGVAVTAKAGNGTWEYSTDGTTWNGVGTVSGTAALLLSSTTQVRYLPDNLNGETATLTFAAWDRTSGTASTNSTRNTADASVNGGTTAFSTGTASASLVVTNVNDAPTLSGGPFSLTTTNENTTSSGTLVSTILAGLTYADVDTSALSGVAITAKAGNGTWEYSTDGTTWNGVGAVTGTAALLLSSTTQVRYLPDNQNGETATLTFAAWDRTSGTASTNSTRNTADASVNGGSTAFSTGTASASLVVTSLNDAPVLSGGPHALSSTDENTTTAGVTVATILGSFTDTDADTGAPARGVAVTAKTSNGTWQYSTDGTTWTAFGSVSGAAALLLSNSTQVRYVPDNQNGETATLTIRSWDTTSGSASVNGTPATADTTTNGTTTAFSTGTGSVTLTVTSVNDAPTLSGGPYALTTTNQNTTSSGTLVSTILAGLTYADVDTSALSGVAITAKAGNGTWEYSTDGTTWNGVGTVTGTAALLLSSTTQVRYVPDNLNGETATLTFAAWDRTSGTASTNSTRNTADASVNGGTTAFSTGTAAASLVVTSVNDAPVLSGGPHTLSTTDENTTTAGVTVATILGSFTDTDSDTGAPARGVAVTAKTSNGTWQYSTDGTTWTAFGPVSGAAALLLSNTTQVRYVPDSQNGETATLTIRSWDTTSGSASVNGTPATADTTTNGTTTAFSTGTGSVTLTVTSVNDAPTLSGGPYALTTTNENTTSSGTLVSTILAGLTYADVDTSALSGVAITAKAGNGTWEYSTDGTTWNGVGAVTGTAALLLSSTTQVRYVPDNLNGETATLTFAAWDRTSGTASTNSTRNTADASANGGTTAFSTGTASASLVVTSVNDAPTAGGLPTSVTVSEDVAGNVDLSGATFADLDGDTLTVTLTANTGTLTSASAGGVTVGGTSGARTFAGTAAALNTFFDTASRVTYTGPSNINGSAAATITVNVNDGTVNPALGTITVNITAVNDAPTLTVPAAQSYTENAVPVTLLTSGSLGDVDSANFTSATATISAGGFTGDGDLLAATTNGTIATSYDSLTKTLTLSGSDTRANYGSVLSSVKYSSSSNDPTNGGANPTRTIVWQLNDGAGANNLSNPATMTVTITALNDAPVLAPAAPTLTAIDENAVANSGQTVASVVGASITDADAGASSGIAVTGLVSGNGTWQYSTDAGSNWTNVGSVSGGSALLLRSTDKLRFVPNGITGTSVSVTYLAWDQTGATAGAQGTKVDTSSAGGTTPFSAANDTATLAVAEVDDAPTLAGTVAAQAVNDQATLTPFSGVTIADIDTPAQTQAVTITLDAAAKGALSNLGGGTYTAGTGVYAFSGTAAAATTTVRALVFTPTPNRTTPGNTETTTFTLATNDGAGGTASDNTTTVISTSINDVPVVTTSGGTTAFTEANNVTSTPVVVDSGLTVTDLDNPTFASATVAITASFQSAEDVLAFANTNSTTFGNIAGSYASGTGILTLTSSGATATVAQWQAALRAVTYTNSSDSPTTSTRTITLVVNDGSGSSTGATKGVSVTTTNDTPTDIALSSTAVSQAGGANATVGTLSTTDLDDTTFVYTLVSGTGSTDNASFNLSGTTLRANNAALLAVGSYAVRVRSTDTGTLFFEKTFTITVTDNVIPTVATAAGPAAGTYGVGQHLDFTITFSEPVVVTGAPNLNVTIGANARTAAYLSGTGTTALVFRYTVVPGDYAASGEVVIGTLALNGGTIQDPSGNAATLTFTPPALPGVLVEARFHSGDTDRDWHFSLAELTRVIELYNVRVGTTRTGAYHTATGTTEDGFDLGVGTLTAYHSADIDRDGQISLSELTRVIELYNTPAGSTRTGEYHRQSSPATEDGFAAGPFVN